MPPPLEYSTDSGLILRGSSSSRGLSERPTSALGVFSPAKNHAILCVGVGCASFSLLAALLSLRWFLLMRRSYRHHLILGLIISDTWKSLWYFIFPIVVFTRGQIHSSSSFCQASGFFLSVGLEASDCAILMIALHTVLYIFKRPQIKGEGGLYPYRKYVYPIWLGWPILSAGLAFTNASGEGYVTSGTFCYLPKRPFWYRLALSWIPRYAIFLTIFSMYAAIWVYVHIKFRGFNDMGNENPPYAPGSASNNTPEKGQSRTSSKALEFRGSSIIPVDGYRKASADSQIDPHENMDRPPWEDGYFITSKPLQDAGVAEADFALDTGSSSTQIPSRHMSMHSRKDEEIEPESRKQSQAPTLGTNYTGETATTEESRVILTTTSRTENHLKSTRSQIRHQLRLLFIYPLVYLLLWTFPFASHCLLYSDYYAAHPPFWLSVITTASLSLQGGIDCAIFSLRERPWNRIDESSRGSWTSLINLFHKHKERDQLSPSTLIEQLSAKRDSNWWEAEGKKRKDSVWMGTDQLNQIISRQDCEENGEENKNE